MTKPGSLNLLITFRSHFRTLQDTLDRLTSELLFNREFLWCSDVNDSMKTGTFTLALSTEEFSDPPKVQKKKRNEELSKLAG